MQARAVPNSGTAAIHRDTVLAPSPSLFRATSARAAQSSDIAPVHNETVLARLQSRPGGNPDNNIVTLPDDTLLASVSLIQEMQSNSHDSGTLGFSPSLSRAAPGNSTVSLHKDIALTASAASSRLEALGSDWHNDHQHSSSASHSGAAPGHRPTAFHEGVWRESESSNNDSTTHKEADMRMRGLSVPVGLWLAAPFLSLAIIR